jgi:hypothetical protein
MISIESSDHWNESTDEISVDVDFAPVSSDEIEKSPVWPLFVIHILTGVFAGIPAGQGFQEQFFWPPLEATSELEVIAMLFAIFFAIGVYFHFLVGPIPPKAPFIKTAFFIVLFFSLVLVFFYLYLSLLHIVVTWATWEIGLWRGTFVGVCIAITCCVLVKTAWGLFLNRLNTPTAPKPSTSAE